MIRELKYEDLESASAVLWKSFYFAEKNVATMQGMELFRDLTSPVSLSMNSFDSGIRLFGYFEDEVLIAVGAIKEKNHILLLYVLPEKQRIGVGKSLLEFMEALCDFPVTLNSSDFAFDFYKKAKYVAAGERKEEDGLFVTPMIKKSISLL